MPLSINIITALVYLGLVGFFAHRLKHPNQELPDWSKYLPFVPMALHLYSLYLSIETTAGQNLSLFNLLSLTAFILVFLIALYRFHRQAPHLMLYAALFAAVCLLVSLIPHKPWLLDLKGDTLGIWHIWLAIISFSLLLMATIQSILVLLLNKKLKTKPSAIHPLMPPLLHMERLNFDIVVIGVLLLTVALVLGFFLPQEVIQAQAMHKIVLTVLAWFSFCTLILLYKSSKISGIRFARLTLIAFGLLALGFIGSKLVIELILQRG
ncbi:inner membrane protein YpjD [Kangiella sp. TOML190]|uniref:cytochrome C assembly family protein n=1 Tax=Kangiella sp. TOML190 TaxID=2931351 RepID=UPI00203AB458|nr:cytochrome c biogenesis protein CcsA [Kangiella sp. TOML190]